jgi:hypothetical protein
MVLIREIVLRSVEFFYKKATVSNNLENLYILAIFLYGAASIWLH